MNVTGAKQSVLVYTIAIYPLQTDLCSCKEKFREKARAESERKKKYAETSDVRREF